MRQTIFSLTVHAENGLYSSFARAIHRLWTFRSARSQPRAKVAMHLDGKADYLPGQVGFSLIVHDLAVSLYLSVELARRS